MKTHLWDLNSLEFCTIKDFSTDLDQKVSARLQDLGFTPGIEVLCLKTPAFGAPKLYQVKDTVFSLDRELASAILIEAKEGP